MANQKQGEATQALIAMYAAQAAQVRLRIDTLIRRIWEALTAYRDADADRFARMVAPVVQAGQRQVAQLTTAYLKGLIGLRVDGFDPSSLHVEPRDYGELRKGTDPLDVYHRPFRQVWYDLSQHKPLDEAVDDAEERAANLAATDLERAKTDASQQVLEQSPAEVVGYRRVLEGDYSCGLCVVASTQRYHKGTLMPIHPGCDCGTAPIFGDADPGQVIDEDRLEKAHAEIMKRFGISDAAARNPDYRKLILDHEHGEIGPVLGVLGQDFTGPSDIPA